MGDPILSVVIPTYERLEVLSQTLDRLLAQNPERLRCEILVIDDGSSDGTCSAVQALIRRDMPIRLFSCPHRGPAAARNVGIEHARGDLILFTGDDMLASPGLLEAHIDAHARHPADQVVIVGEVCWSPDLTITPLMRWLVGGGPFFDFHSLSPGESVDHLYFITANLSLKRSLLGSERFDERFEWAALEDIELGYRLAQRGMRLVFQRVPVYHFHPTTLESAARRMDNTGRALRRLERKWPEMPGLDRIRRFTLEPLFRHQSLSGAIDRMCRQIADWMGERTPILVQRYVLSYARWTGYDAERKAEK